jgi:hypothetical protein
MLGPGGLIFLLAIAAVVAVLAAIAGRRRAQRRFIGDLLRTNPLSTQRKVIASLSTLPDRIDNLEPTILSLLDQTRPPDEIVLWVPHFSKRQQRNYEIPKYLESLRKVRIARCENDWGPATKFIPIVQQELAEGRDQTLILVVDDDRIYPHDLVETYLFYHEKLPDAALCFRGAPMPQGLKWTKPKLRLASKIREPERVAVIMGCGSYLIQPRFFDARLWDYSKAPAAAFYMDDIWISGWLDRGGVEKYVVPGSAMMRTARSQRRSMTLDDVPNGRRWSNNEVIRFFAESWNVFVRP